MAEAEIRAAASYGAKVNMICADLSLMSDTARLAGEIGHLTDKVHALLNNEGGVRSELIITPEGNEATFAGNHLGHFLLTQRLMPLPDVPPRLRARRAPYVLSVCPRPAMKVAPVSIGTTSS